MNPLIIPPSNVLHGLLFLLFNFLREEYNCDGPNCSVRSSDFGAISAHYSTSHRFSCSECNLSFISQNYLDDHNTKFHPSAFKSPVIIVFNLCQIFSSLIVLSKLAKRHFLQKSFAIFIFKKSIILILSV